MQNIKFLFNFNFINATQCFLFMYRCHENRVIFWWSVWNKMVKYGNSTILILESSEYFFPFAIAWVACWLEQCTIKPPVKVQISVIPIFYLYFVGQFYSPPQYLDETNNSVPFIFAILCVFRCSSNMTGCVKILHQAMRPVENTW